MSTQQASSSKKLSSSLDTSHLKVKFPFKAKYGNYVNGKFVEPKSGKYFDNTTPITNEVICQVPRSNDKDIDFALDAAHAAFPAWGKTSITERSNILLKIADVIEKSKSVSNSGMFRQWKANKRMYGCRFTFSGRPLEIFCWSYQSGRRFCC